MNVFLHTCIYVSNIKLVHTSGNTLVNFGISVVELRAFLYTYLYGGVRAYHFGDLKAYEHYSMIGLLWIQIWIWNSQLLAFVTNCPPIRVPTDL